MQLWGRYRVCSLARRLFPCATRCCVRTRLLESAGSQHAHDCSSLIPHCHSWHGTFALFPVPAFLPFLSRPSLPQSIAAIEGLHAIFLKCFDPKRVDVGSSEASRGVPRVVVSMFGVRIGCVLCFRAFSQPPPPPASLALRARAAPLAVCGFEQFVCISCLNPCLRRLRVRAAPNGRSAARPQTRSSGVHAWSLLRTSPHVSKLSTHSSSRFNPNPHSLSPFL